MKVTTSARDWAGDGLPGHQPDEVRGVDPEDRADLVGEVAEELEVDEPGIALPPARTMLGQCSRASAATWS